MTTGRKLILKLTNGQRKRFILNIIRIHGAEKAKVLLERKYQTAVSFISGAFYWSNSTEGDNYWREISSTL